MSHIEKTISRLPTMNAKALATLRGNANAALARKPDDQDARRLLDALDAMEGGKPKTAEFEVTGLLAWEKHRPGEGTFRAFHGENVVGRIFKRADHSSRDKDVYSLEILGAAIPGAFHHIRDAREAGEREFCSRRELSED
ncbi:hypothetical protein OEZ60_15405 [Defluviimonas sp. WL0024]|uniref:Uncharacterized protein n=1 Tax=Albidovulum salinarum TaxID=2984153 RepID=A0ABT2X613_9RHOB|nr:hypothetical protein [Defluviimonas sp. WL0024]MCU9849387.1 hypothetical protein [Defluviimonas sp. WL0024]